MDQRHVGRTGLQVSRLGLGTMTWGRDTDEHEAREQLLSFVWGYDFDPGSNVVDVYVGYLRRKFGATAISTVRGMGYRFDG